MSLGGVSRSWLCLWLLHSCISNSWYGIMAIGFLYRWTDFVFSGDEVGEQDVQSNGGANRRDCQPTAMTLVIRATTLRMRMRRHVLGCHVARRLTHVRRVSRRHGLDGAPRPLATFGGRPSDGRHGRDCRRTALAFFSPHVLSWSGKPPRASQCPSRPRHAKTPTAKQATTLSCVCEKETAGHSAAPWTDAVD